VVVRDSAGITIVENDLNALAPACSVDHNAAVVIGSAVGDPAHELHRVFGASRLSDGRIALVNQGTQELRIYDVAGRFIRSAGRAGQGPGEFRDAFHLWVLPGDSIWVGDYRPWQFHVFSPEGNWVRTVRPTPEYANSPEVVNVLDDGSSVLASRPLIAYSRRFEVRDLTVVVHGPDGALRDTIGMYPNGRWGILSDEPGSPGLYPLFESFVRVDASASRVVIGHGSRPEFSIFDAASGFDLKRIIRWTTRSREVTAADISAERERLVAPYAEMDPAMRKRLIDPLVSEQRPVADEFPAFSTVMLGRAGDLWVREYVKPREPESNPWIVFGPDGQLQCRAALPVVDQVLEFGPGYFLALDRDDLGVERVVMHHIAPRPY